MATITSIPAFMISVQEPTASHFPERYKEIAPSGPLKGISVRINFERIRSILPDLYENDIRKGGRANYDFMLTVKFLLL